ncbi:hypothetical protein MXB_4867, partial [Myxobolus squamalis]
MKINLSQFIIYGMFYFLFNSIHGIYQEKISRGYLIINQTVSTSSFFAFHSFYAFCCVIFSVCINTESKQFSYLECTNKSLIIAALYYALSSIFGISSLGYVNYPTHVVIKSIKPLFVMICLMIGISRKIKFIQLFVGVILFIGVALFSHINITSFGIIALSLGDSYLFLSLLFDGLNSVIQDKTRQNNTF